MRNADDKNNQGRVLDLAEYAVISDTIAPVFGQLTFEGRSEKPRIVRTGDPVRASNGESSAEWQDRFGRVL